MFGFSEKLAEATTTLVYLEPAENYRCWAYQTPKRDALVGASQEQIQRSATSLPPTAGDKIPSSAKDSSDQVSRYDPLSAQQSDCAVNEIFAWFCELGKTSG